ncbi:Molybdopterin molybdenumtransferase [Hartmannibacter diazotrophicus]|uniref:Molybdopterin molybdenumtransferase n=1 Tax=Hartmannibacter diazotrophicus TaxID=1482074 RepID=A0A2C9D495_9HYPH|nr:gephyrin-like molybdotransferase Glp [Hartmannibacter diazotrophicus]SON55053.1 Molybdopterin molybdenumtransferase [Hartmannibacter diazotrophicus]
MALMPVKDARQRLLAGVAPAEVETVLLDQATGRTLATDLAAKRSQPPFPASAMDGYAVRAADLTDLSATLTVIGEASAGHGFTGSLGPLQAVRIFTGAPMPDGADTVLIQENAERQGDKVVALQGEPKGRFVRPLGLDFLEGEVLLKAGRLLDERALSLAAAMNHASVPARRKPKIAILATGDELVAPGKEPGSDQIVASNAIGLAAIVRMAGGEPVDLGIAPDDLPEIRRRIGWASDADVVTLLGGASVGEHDFTQQALVAEGFELDFWKIAMRPGKPLMSGRMDGRVALGLPGNPVASLVCARLFLLPLIKTLLGQADVEPESEAAILGADLAANDQREDYLRARLERRGDAWIAKPFETQDSSMLALMSAADCLVIREAHAPAAKAGDVCRIIRF